MNCWRFTRVKEKIMDLLEKINDERLLENIYWYIERKLVRKPPERKV